MVDEAAKDIEAGQQFLAEGEFEKAVKRFNKAIKLDPKNADAYYGKAEAWVGATSLSVDEVLESYAKAVELQPKNPVYLSSYGAFCLQAGKVGQAEEIYNKAAETDDENAGVYYNEFGYEYYQAMQRQYEGQLNAAMLAEVRKKAAKYLLKSIGLEIEPAQIASLIK